MVKNLLVQIRWETRFDDGFGGKKFFYIWRETTFLND